MIKVQKLKKYIKKSIYLTVGLSVLAINVNPKPVQAEMESYQVRPGDTLFGISRTFGKSIDELTNLNNLSPRENIQQGDVILIGDSVHTQFIENIGSSARKIAKDNGLYASVMVAQAILESNYGKSTLSAPPYHNLFGIKGSYQGESVMVSTNEFLDNQWLIENEQFRRYPSYHASLLNNARVLRAGNSWNQDYYRGTWKENTNHYTDATDWLEDRYATDPNYGSKLNDIIQRYQLTKYDEPSPERIVHTSSTTSTTNSNHSTHMVTSGDTLYNVAKRSGMTVQSLKELNQIHSNVIKVGQTLTVTGDIAPKSSTSSQKESHTVQAGDTLYNIAKRYGVSVSQLKASNQKTSDNVRLGEQLTIIGSTSTSSNTHTVQVGDTLFNIAKRYNTTVDSLKVLNQLNSNRIEIGQTVKY